MRVAVTTPTGHIGSVVAEYLLDSGVDVRLLARHPDKLQRLVTRGAGVAEGCLEDEDFVVQATRGADCLFWVTPTDLGSSDLRAFQDRVGRAACSAISVNRIRRVVNISSIGAHVRTGGGPIDGLYDVEQLLDNVATDITHLRPGYFFENFLMHVETIAKEGKIYLPVAGSASFPMVATRDIALLAADRLLDPCWKGRWVRSLHGPADLSFDEAAREISEGLQREVIHVKVSSDTARKTMIAGGLSEQVADLMLELYRGRELGLLRSDEDRSPATYTPTRLVEFTRIVIRPCIEQLVEQSA